LQRSGGSSKADGSGQIDGKGNHARSIAMSAQGRISRKVDGLPSLIPLSLSFDSPLPESFHSLLMLFEFLSLPIQLGLESGNPLT